MNIRNVRKCITASEDGHTVFGYSGCEVSYIAWGVENACDSIPVRKSLFMNEGQSIANLNTDTILRVFNLFRHKLNFKL